MEGRESNHGGFVERRQVLLVESDPDHRYVTGTLLEHAGFSVVEATDGESAVRLALEVRPAAVLMEVALPRLDGWTATHRIKAEAPDLCVVIVTAHASWADRKIALAAGADRFVAKPVPPRDLVRIVEECIGKERRA
jgi:two-component system OmpR family response regulator